MRPQENGSEPGSPAVAVAFSRAVCRGSGYRFACELLKHVLHQRNQLPLPYEQLAYFCRRAAQVRGEGRGVIPVLGGGPGPGGKGGRGLCVLLASSCPLSVTLTATCRGF